MKISNRMRFQDSHVVPNKLLIIADSSIDALVTSHLSGEPVEIHACNDSAAGLARAAELLPHLILLDVDTTNPSGLDICRQLKQNPLTINIPIVFLTGASTADKTRGLELGAIDYVTKPFDPADLRARVRLALRLKYLMDLLASKGMIDGLTGLWNRSYFEERLAAEVAAITRTPRPLGCIIADIDNFKNLNDTQGHAFGDEVLRGVAQALQHISRAEDIVCRFGGEEFIILTPGIGMVGATAFAERCAKQSWTNLSPTTTGHSKSPAASASPTPASAASPAWSNPPSAALDHAKSAGRNCVMDSREAA